jgi:hypothetical protein
MPTVERRIEKLEQHFPQRCTTRDPRDMSSEELAYELLETTLELLEAYAANPEMSFLLDRLRQDAERLHVHRHRRLKYYAADDDARLAGPFELHLSDLLRELLGRFHDKVKDPAVLLERYRGRLPDRVLAAAYYAAWHHKGSSYSPHVRAKLQQLAGLPMEGDSCEHLISAVESIASRS